MLKRPIMTAVAAVFATALTVVVAAPANAGYSTLNLGSCHTTILNGSSFARTTVTSSNVCSRKLIAVKVQFPGTAAYWTSAKSGTATILQTTPPSGSVVIQSHHTIVNEAAEKYLWVG